MNLKVLVIEDDSLDQHAFIRLVEKSNLPYHVQIAATIQEARAMLATQTFDVALVDYHLPDGFGFEVLDSVPSDVTVIFITGAGSEETAIAALRAGASDYLVKDKNRVYLKLLPLTLERAVERKNQERQLLTLSQAVISSYDSIYITDINNRITHVNSAFCQTYGYEPEEIIGRSCFDLAAPESQPRRQKGTAELEIYHQKRDGSYFPISMTRSPVEDPRGQLLGYVIVVRDFTERQQALRALEQSEERYRSLVSALADGVILQNRSGEVLACNASAERILGCNMTELKTLSHRGSIWDAIRSDSGGERDPMLATLQTGQAQHQVIMSIRTPGDSLTWIAVNTEPLQHRDSSEIYAVVTSFTDITPLKNAITERDQLIEQLDAFAHTAAHDLKSPAALIVGYAELLISEYEQMEPAEIQRFLDTIDKAGHNMVQIIDSLLLLAGTTTMEEIPLTAVDMTGLIASTQARLQHLIDEKGAEVRIVGDLPAVHGFAPWVEQILVNYLSNALKYGGVPPKILIGAEKVPDGMVRYWVQDNGQGLTPEEQARLFQPFTRLSTGVADGHGLGLSVVRRITRRLGGTANVASKIGRGSAFSFTLPAAETSLPAYAV